MSNKFLKRFSLFYAVLLGVSGLTLYCRIVSALGEFEWTLISTPASSRFTRKLVSLNLSSLSEHEGLVSLQGLCCTAIRCVGSCFNVHFIQDKLCKGIKTCLRTIVLQ